MSELTKGSVMDFYSRDSLNDFRPVVQINAIKRCAATGGSATTDKHKFLVSDGTHYTTGLSMGSDINKMVEDGRITKNTVVQIDRSNKTMANGKPVFLILDLTFVAQKDDKIGNPQKIDDDMIRQATANRKPAPQPNTSRPSGGMAGSSDPGAIGNIYPIQSLNPYQNKWTIKARVTKKCDVRNWSNARGEGKVFSMELMDDSGEIRCTGFTEAVDKFYNLIEQDSVYYISKCSLRTANKQYTSIKNDYEMTIGNDTTIIKCEDSSDVPELKLNYTRISDLESIDNNSYVDIIGVASHVGDVQEITVRASGKKLIKRELKLQDKSGAAVSLTLWGNDAENFDTSSENPVIGVKAAKVSDFGGRSLSVSFNSTLMVNPDNADAHEIRGWYETVGKDQQVRQMSSGQVGGGSRETPHKTFQEIKNINVQDQPVYFANSATVVFVKKDNCMYTACPSADCNKKVIQESESEYRCEKCDKVYPEFHYRLMLTVKLADYTGNEWVTCFQETAEKLLGINAAELGRLKESNEAEFDRTMNSINFKSYTFKMRAKFETYMDETRLKCTALSVDDVDPVAESRRLLEEIKLLEG